MVQVNIITLEKDLSYQGTVILKYKIQYPQIISKSNSHFNEFNYAHAMEFKDYAEGKLFQDAIQQYEYNISNGYPIMVYELYSIPTITYQTTDCISLYFDDYTYTGGAHGSTIRISQNWNLKLDRQFSLANLFPHSPYFVLSILQDISHQIEEQIVNGNDVYFDDYCKLLLDTFNPHQFYLIPNDNTYHIVIYFQQYDIAPYSTGIPTFILSENNSILD